MPDNFDGLVDRCYTAGSKLIDQLWRLSPLDRAIGPLGFDQQDTALI